VLLSQTLVLRSREKLHVKARNLMSVASCECVVGCNKLTTVTTVLRFSRLSSPSSRCYYIGRLSDFLQLRVQHAQHNHDQFRFRHRYHQEQAAPNETLLNRELKLWSLFRCPQASAAISAIPPTGYTYSHQPPPQGRLFVQPPSMATPSRPWPTAIPTRLTINLGDNSCLVSF
jgi:hypothetical protein